MIEAELADVAVAGDGGYFVVLLKTAKGDYVPIAIDNLQAMSILAGRSKEAFPRPLTHDLLLSVLEIMGAAIKRIEISDIISNEDGSGTFYAKLILENRGLEYELDARPSDALALAVRVDAPLLIAESVVEKAGMSEFADGRGGAEA